jgi:hypothetical protein
MLDMRHLHIHAELRASRLRRLAYVVAKLGSGDSVSGVTTTPYHAVMAGGRARGWDGISLSVQRALLSLVRCLVTETVDEPMSLYLSWRSTSTAITATFRTWFMTGLVRCQHARDVRVVRCGTRSFRLQLQRLLWDQGVINCRPRRQSHSKCKPPWPRAWRHG